MKTVSIQATSDKGFMSADVPTVYYNEERPAEKGVWPRLPGRPDVYRR